MLTLSDADLAWLRLECWKYYASKREYREAELGNLADMADLLVDWCLRDRDKPVEEKWDEP